jgi:hypothetical protein
MGVGVKEVASDISVVGTRTVVVVGFSQIGCRRRRCLRSKSVEVWQVVDGAVSR